MPKAGTLASQINDATKAQSHKGFATQMNSYLTNPFVGLRNILPQKTPPQKEWRFVCSFKNVLSNNQHLTAGQALTACISHFEEEYTVLNIRQIHIHLFVRSGDGILLTPNF